MDKITSAFDKEMNHRLEGRQVQQQQVQAPTLNSKNFGSRSPESMADDE